MDLLYNRGKELIQVKVCKGGIQHGFNRKSADAISTEGL